MALVTILPETELSGFTLNEELGAYGYYENGVQAFLSVGDTYIVKWDGVSYTCTVQDASLAFGAGAVGLGNLSAVGGTGNNEPFAIGWMSDGTFALFAFDTQTSHTVGLYQETSTDEEGSGGDSGGDTGEDTGGTTEVETIVLKDRNGNDITYQGINMIKLKTTSGGTKTFAACDDVEKTVAPDFSAGDMEVVPDEGTLLSKVTIEKPETLLPENVRSGVELAGVTGEFIGDTEEATVELALADGNQVVSPSADGKVISKVTIVKPETLVPSNIAKDVDIGGVIGTMEAGGGGGLGTGAYHVQVIDYDGTVLAEQYLDSGAVFELPDPPSHDRLVFDGWSASVEVVNNTVTVADADIMVGAMYYTASGATELDIVLNANTGLKIIFKSGALTNMTSIDWGDGTTDSTETHTYTDYGEYTIKIHGMTAVGYLSSSYSMVQLGGSAVRKIFFANTVTQISAYCCQNWPCLQAVVLPRSLLAYGTGYMFQNCYQLKALVYPSLDTPSYAWIGMRDCYYCYSLEKVVIPNGYTTVNEYAFYYCRKMDNIVLPHSITTIGKYAFGNALLKKVNLSNNISTIADYAFNATSFAKIVFPPSVTTFGGGCFNTCYCATEYDFSRHTSVPTLGTTSFIQKLASAKILVPAALYDEWIAATNWSSFANYIVAV